MSSEITETLQKTIAEDIPVLRSHYSTIQEQIKEVTEFISNFTESVKSGERSVDNGISLLDVKYHCLLSYLIDLLLVMQTKVSGKSLKNLSSINHLVENRTVLEKIRPLEHKLKYQIDKLLKESRSGALSENDPLNLKPNVENLESKLGDSDEDSDENAEETTDKPKKYVPPHIAAMRYDEDGNDKAESKLQKAKERALKRSSIISELVQENSEAPMEILEHSGAKKRVFDERNHRTRYEEENFKRVMLTKKQKHAERSLLHQSELDSITKFGDISALDGRSMLEAAAKSAGGAGKRKGGKRKSFGNKKRRR